MRRTRICIAIATATLAAAIAGSAFAQGQTPSRQVKRGEYLANYGGCNDCHTPKMMTPNGPQPDPARLLSGHPADVPVAPVPDGALGPGKWIALTNEHLTAWAGPWGVSYAANLTPDATGLAKWTVDDFIKTMRTGKHLGTGRPVLPPMPWFSVAVLNDADIRALFAYLKSIKPIANQVPAPVPPKR